MQNSRYPVIAIFGIFCFLTACFISQRMFEGDGKGWKHIVTSDGRGYYAYLPALIIDGDPAFSKVVERESSLLGYPGYKPGYMVRVDGHPLNKYFSGEALLLLPFFLLGLLLSCLFGTPIDGYSFFFQISVGFGALFYLLMGLFYLFRILQYFRIRPGLTAFILPVVLFGTNLFYYTIWQLTMSHLYSFFAINGLICCLLSAFRSWDHRSAIRTGLFLGVVFLIRPTNLVVLILVPFLAGDKTTLVNYLKTIWQKKNVTLVFFAAFILLAVIQPLLWFVQTGKFFIWSYHNEGFLFSRPEILNVLFSYRKGLFIYSPIIFLSWTGLIFLIFKNRIRFFSMLIFIAVSTYIISCWWNWYYGDGFGLRAFIDYYGIFCLLLAIPMNHIPRRFMVPLSIAVILPMVFLNLFQTWQYTHNVIHPNSMNREKYNYVFLKADSVYINCLGGNREIADYSVDLQKPDLLLWNDFEREPDSWSNISIQRSSRSFSPDHAGYLDSVHPFSPGVCIQAQNIGNLPSRFFIKGELMVWDSLKGASNNALIVLSMDSIKPSENYWQGSHLNDVPRKDMKTWRKCSFSLTLPEIVNPRGILKVYIWNTGKQPMLIDDFELRFYRVKD